MKVVKGWSLFASLLATTVGLGFVYAEPCGDVTGYWCKRSWHTNPTYYELEFWGAANSSAGDTTTELTVLPGKRGNGGQHKSSENGGKAAKSKGSEKKNLTATTQVKLTITGSTGCGPTGVPDHGDTTLANIQDCT
jgi:hypothetical protein